MRQIRLPKPVQPQAKQPKEEAKSSAAHKEGPTALAPRKNELIVENLPDDATEDSLQGFFKSYGELTKCKLLRGKAFIEYADYAAAKQAIENTNEQQFGGQTISVAFSGQAGTAARPAKTKPSGQATRGQRTG